MDTPKMYSQVEFVEWLRSHLKTENISARAWALDRGIDPATMSRVLNGQRAPSLDFVVRCGWIVLYAPDPDNA